MSILSPADGGRQADEGDANRHEKKCPQRARICANGFVVWLFQWNANREALERK